MENKEPTLNHLACIMDGNDRWAKQNNKTRREGHKAGAENVFDIIEQALELGIQHLSLFAFSAENWHRPKDEVADLMDLFSYYAVSKLEEIQTRGIKVKFVGRITKFTPDLQNALKKIEDASQNNDKLYLYVIVSYSSKLEIVDAVKRIINEKISAEEIDESNFEKFLYCPEMPDVDLLIRTSNVNRLSNFLLWQSAYAELYFCEKLWPDFKKDDLKLALINYQNRKRNFGLRDVE